MAGIILENSADTGMDAASVNSTYYISLFFCQSTEMDDPVVQVPHKYPCPLIKLVFL